MNIDPSSKVLHFSFADEAFIRADAFAGKFNMRQVGGKPYEKIDVKSKELPYGDKEFDFVYATHVLQYVDYPNDILQEIIRICKKAHFKEYSDFAERIFGWGEHKWILDVENGELKIKAKNDGYGRFEHLFHQLYVNSPEFYQYHQNNPGLFTMAFDWDEKDNIVEKKEVEEEVEEKLFLNNSKSKKKEESKLELKDKKLEFKDDKKEEEKQYKIVKKRIKVIKDVITPVFLPCQTESFYDVELTLAKISDKIDIRRLQEKMKGH